MDFTHSVLLGVPTAVVLVSLGLYVPTLPSDKQTNQGRIRLPIDEQEQDHLHNGLGQQTGNDPGVRRQDAITVTDSLALDTGEGHDHERFDYVLEAVQTDGQPINEEAFWRTTRRQKLFYIVLLLIPALISVATLGFHITKTYLDYPTVLFLSLAAVAQLYLLGLSVPWLSQTDVPRHWATTIHQGTVLCVTWLCLATFIVLPQKSVHRGNNDVFAPFPGTTANMRLIQVLMAAQPLMLLPALIIVAGYIKRGPKLHFPATAMYPPAVLNSMNEHYAETNEKPAPLDPRTPNVTEELSTTLVGQVMYTWIQPLMVRGNSESTFNVWDLPILPKETRALHLFLNFRRFYGNTRFQPTPGTKPSSERFHLLGIGFNLPTGFSLLFKVFRANKLLFWVEIVLASVSAGLYYGPAIFMRQLVKHLEDDPERKNMREGWVWCGGLFLSNAVMFLTIGYLWYITSALLQHRIKLQLSTMLFSKTLVKQEISNPTESESKPKETAAADDGKEDEGNNEEQSISSKAQIMTLFTVDADRVADFAFHSFTLVDSPIEILVGTIFLYRLLGVSAFVGLAASIFTIPLNHYASKVIIDTQENLMTTRDERTGVMNEILGAIRMIKFMAWERKFQQKVSTIRTRELHYLKRNYLIEVLLGWVWAITPVIVTLVTFYHYVMIAKQPLGPAVAFPAVTVLNELRFSLSSLPEAAISILQGFVSLRRVQKYLGQAEIETSTAEPSDTIAFRDATVTWPKDTLASDESVQEQEPDLGDSATLRTDFALRNVNVQFPKDSISLICGRLGSGKTLMLLGLLGEAEVTQGQVECPRSPPNALQGYGDKVAPEHWVSTGRTAYASQVPWLQNATIRQNIIFGAPEDEDRFRKVLTACCLDSDLRILEDAEWTEVGEKGLNLSGGQKARISLARAVYSRASLIILDDILSALDAHTASAIVTDCLQGDLMKGRTVIIVSHHVRLLLPAASYIVSLDRGTVQYAGDTPGFLAGDYHKDLEPEETHDLVDVTSPLPPDDTALIEDQMDPESVGEPATKQATTLDKSVADAQAPTKKTARKFVEDEVRQTGTISWQTWKVYLGAQGSWVYWAIFVIVALVGTTPPLWENLILDQWSGSYSKTNPSRSPTFYITIYAIATSIGTIVGELRFAILYVGSIRASKQIHATMLERVLFATVRFHDTSVRGRTLNRFGKDLEGLDSATADNFGRSLFYFLNVIVTLASITWVAGWRFSVAALALAVLYRQAAGLYAQTARDLRRLDSTTRSPLYAVFGEAISGLQVIRAYGGSVAMMRLMCQNADSNITSAIFTQAASRWISARFNMISSAIVGLTGAVVLVMPISASSAGFALAFALSISGDMLFATRTWVSLQQALIAVERLDEYCNLPIEAPEHDIDVPADWPRHGEIDIKNLVVRYAPDLPAVLHDITLHIAPGQRVGIVGATGCGKSTLALSLFRFVEPTQGSIEIDGVDISNVGLTDLRSRVTIIPQDPTILSGTLRSTLDIFDEYSDAEIFAALKRVHLLDTDATTTDEISAHKHVFQDLTSSVSEGGDNFSQGEKQLLCMARAILRSNKILIMDEATASIDYETDQLISKTIREEFSSATLVTIAHRLTTIIDYDKILLLDQGRLIEFDSPHALLENKRSRFYSLCKASGPSEFVKLQRAAEVASKVSTRRDGS